LKDTPRADGAFLAYSIVVALHTAQDDALSQAVAVVVKFAWRQSSTAAVSWNYSYFLSQSTARVAWVRS